MDDFGFKKFLECLEQTTSFNSTLVNESNNLLLSFRQYDIIKFLIYSSKAAIFSSDAKIIVVAMSAIKDTIRSRRSISIELIRNTWFSERANEMRDLIKNATLSSLVNNDERVRNIAGATLALVLQIEMKNWVMIFKKLIDISKQNDMMRNSVIKTFEEIFSLRIFNNKIPINEIPTEMVDLLVILSNQLEGKDISYQMKYDASRTFIKLISKLPQLFMNDNSILNLFNLIRNVLLSFDDEQIYRNMHFMMLEIVEQLYEYSNKFFNFIYELTSYVIENKDANYKVISLDFWANVWEYECSIKKKDQNLFINITSHAASQFTMYIFKFLIVKSEKQNEIFDQNNPQLEDYAMITLRAFYSSVYNLPEFEKFYQIFIMFLNEMLKDNSSWIKINAFVMSLISVTCSSKNDKIRDLLKSKINFIEELTSTSFLNLVDHSLQLISLIITYYDELLTEENIISGIYTTIIKIINNIPPIASRCLFVLNRLCKHISQEQIDINFNLISNIIISKIDDPEFEASDYVMSSYDALSSLIHSSGESSYQKIFNILTILVNMLKQTFIDFNHGNELKQIGICGLITSIIQKIQRNVLPLTPNINYILFNILSNSSNLLNDEAMICFSAMITSIKTDFLQYAERFLQLANKSLLSQSPNLILMTSLAIGDLCKVLGDSILNYLNNEVTFIFQYITNLDESLEITMLPTLLTSLSLILDGIGRYLPESFLLSVWNYLLLQISYDIDSKSSDDFNYANLLFSSLSKCFSSILKSFSSDKLSSPLFIREVKYKLMKIFDKIDSHHLYEIETLESSYRLLRCLGEKMGPSINILLHKSSIASLFTNGTNLLPTNSPTTKLAISTQIELNRL